MKRPLVAVAFVLAVFLLSASFVGALSHNASISSSKPGTVLCMGAAGVARPRLKVLDAALLERTGKANYKIVLADGDYMFLDMDTGTCMFTRDPDARNTNVNSTLAPPEKGPTI
jgi:hypothetical protein